MILVLTVLGAVAWLTRHPESALVRQAEGWPWIGPLALQFRQAYGPARDAGAGAAGETDRIEWIVKEPERPAEPPWTGTPEYVWVLEGTQIFSEPRLGSEKTRLLHAITNLARLERRGDWFRVWYRGEEGWVHLPGYEENVPPLGSEPEPVLPLPPQQPDPQRLAKARELLGEGAYDVELAGYRFYTDVWDTELLERMGRVLGGLERTYAQRYGLELLGRPTGAVVLYRRQEDLEALQRLEGLEGLPAAGHAAGGVVALTLARRPKHEVVSTLVHEVAHLMNRRAVGPALPPWLDEGLSDDLANLPIAGDGSLLASGWSGRRVVHGSRVTYEGALASLRVSARQLRSGRAPELETLLRYDWRQFVVSRRSRLHYDLSAFFIRHLLDEPTRTRGFRAFLRATAAGEPISPEALRRRLDRPWAQIQADFAAWLEGQAQSGASARADANAKPPAAPEPGA